MPSPKRDFYPPELTERSRSVLDRVHDALPDAVLIGGWAMWVRTGGAMSHDIDLIVTRPQLAVISRLSADTSESRHLAGRKWRGVIDGIHLDLYVPHQSLLGQHLQLRTEWLIERREQVKGWVLLDLAGHLATKFAALLDRPDSIPGDKDRGEIMALLALGVDPGEAVGVMHRASARSATEVSQLIAEAFDYLRDLDLDRRGRQALTEMATDWVARSQPMEQGGSDTAEVSSRRRSPPRPRGPDLGR
ncbi:MAG: hypothetical protein ACRD0A_16335 [Acidimicrobiales bacterium]